MNTYKYSTGLYAGYPIEYDLFQRDVSVTWESDTTAIVRFHRADSLPQNCDYTNTCFLKVVDEYCELKALLFDPGPDAHRIIRMYLKSLGLKGFYRRLKHGKVVTVYYK